MSRQPSRPQTQPRVTLTVFALVALLLLAACNNTPAVDPLTGTQSESTPVPTPAAEALTVTGTNALGERLHVIVPAITIGQRAEAQAVRVFVALVDPQGTYSYLLFPANRSGEDADRIALVDHPLEIGIGASTPYVALWALAFHTTGHTAAESQGWDALATSLALGFREWLLDGDPADDPLAGAVNASGGTLYAWYAEIDVLGQVLTRLDPAEGWGVNLGTATGVDDALAVVFDVDHIPAPDAPTPELEEPPEDTSIENGAAPDTPYTLVLDETFNDPTSAERWYHGRAGTFINEVVGGGYQIRLLGATRRPIALSWGSMSGLRFGRGLIEAEMRMAEGDSADATYGLWLRHQDDNNFLYVGLSNRGEYRVAVIVNNRVQTLVQDWQFHPAISTGTASNLIAIELFADGRHDLSVNDTHLLTFRDRTFGDGSIAFFCSARTTPTTCRLETLRVWQPAS
ncbi:MAG: hypothetical protein GX613_11525 [Chloroflexi bacterium]|nr:hypothetical protein [Chloroflexota bacterium]